MNGAPGPVGPDEKQIPPLRNDKQQRQMRGSLHCVLRTPVGMTAVGGNDNKSRQLQMKMQMPFGDDK